MLLSLKYDVSKAPKEDPKLLVLSTYIPLKYSWPTSKAEQDQIPSPFPWNQSRLESGPEFLEPVSEPVGTGYPVPNFFQFCFI